LGFLETLVGRGRERWITGLKASPHTIKISLQLGINYLGIECEIFGCCGEYQSIQGKRKKGALEKSKYQQELFVY